MQTSNLKIILLLNHCFKMWNFPTPVAKFHTFRRAVKYSKHQKINKFAGILRLNQITSQRHGCCLASVQYLRTLIEQKNLE